MTEKTKKSIRKSAVFLMLVLAVIAMPRSVYATVCGNGVSYDWYTKRNKENKIPELDKGLSLINKYNSVYANKAAQERGDKVIYLTFDAGYENGNIERILNTLKKHEAPGAFFILKNLIKRNPDLVCRMGEEGHLICNHTATHPDMSKIKDKEDFEKQLKDLENTLTEWTGMEMSRYYRPPEGRFSEDNLRHADELGYKTVFWSFAYPDWDNNRQPDPEYSINLILANAHPGQIMLLHPTSKTNADILDTVLTRLKEDGYRFGSLDELA